MDNNNIHHSYSHYLAGVVLGVLVTMGVIAALIPLFAGSGLDSARWVKDGLDKKMAAASTRQGKIIILAGSNALFGFSAQHVEEKHGIPAVNMAMHAGLGRNYMFHYSKPVISAGDIIVLPLEYELYEPEQSWHAKVFQVLVHDQDYFWHQSFLQQARFVAGIDLTDWIRLFKERLFHRASQLTTYDASTLNAWGDETVSHTKPSDPDKVAALVKQKPKHLVLDPAALDDIAAFSDYAHAQGAVVVVTFPNIINTALDEVTNAGFFTTLENGLQERGVLLLGDPRTAAFTPDVAYDSIYHQNHVGQVNSTERLLQDLRQAGLLRQKPSL